MTSPINGNSNDISMSQRSDFDVTATRGGKLYAFRRADGTVDDNVTWPRGVKPETKKRAQDAMATAIEKRDEYIEMALVAEANGQPNIAASLRKFAADIQAQVDGIKRLIEAGNGASPMGGPTVNGIAQTAVSELESIDFAPGDSLVARVNGAREVPHEMEAPASVWGTVVKPIIEDAFMVPGKSEAESYMSMSDKELLRAMETDPKAFYTSLGDLTGEERNMIVMRLNQIMQTQNQIFSAVSNLMKAQHDTQKAVLANLRV